MEEPVRSTAYLGPEKGRWRPSTWSDVVSAAASGLLDESHWVDLKRELSTKATANTDLAKDLASLAVHGGLLVIGIEDHDSHAGSVCGVELTGLADRIDQIARDKIHPSLIVRSEEVPDPDNPGRGCILVHIPASAQAPHMVDYVYYGRSDRSNTRLGDEQVREILASRDRNRQDILANLQQVVNDNPMSQAERENGHIYLVAQPETASDEALVDFLSKPDALQIINRMLQEIRVARGGEGFSPDLQQLSHRIRRAEGCAFNTFSTIDQIYENGMIDLVVREDGGIRLTCGRGTDTVRKQTVPESPPIHVVIPIIVQGLTRSFVALAGRLGDEYGAYQGQWQLGIRMDRLHGAMAADYVQNPFRWGGQPYTRDDYEKVRAASTEQLVNAPHTVGDQLIAPLFRGLGVADRYIKTAP